MVSKLYAVMGVTVAIALVIAGLWGWGLAGAFSARSAHPDVAVWAARGGALAALAGAQVLGLTFIVEAVYARDRASEIMRVAASLVCTLALVGALGLGLMSM